MKTSSRKNTSGHNIDNALVAQEIMKNYTTPQGFVPRAFLHTIFGFVVSDVLQLRLKSTEEEASLLSLESILLFISCYIFWREYTCFSCMRELTNLKMNPIMAKIKKYKEQSNETRLKQAQQELSKTSKELDALRKKLKLLWLLQVYGMLQGLIFRGIDEHTIAYAQDKIANLPTLIFFIRPDKPKADSQEAGRYLEPDTNSLL